MNSLNNWRLDIAKQIGQLYAANPHVDAVIVGGSIARGHADQFSDIDLGVFWSQDPTEVERQQVVEQARADLFRLYDYDPAESVWSDDFYLGRDETKQPLTGILVEVSHYASGFIEQILHEVLKEFSIRELSHNLIAGIVTGHPLQGHDMINSWKDRAGVYPRELQIAMIYQWGVIDHFWRWKMYLHRRQNLPMLYQSFSQIQNRLLHVLL